MLRLYDYWRSSAAYRVRIALNLKGLSYTSVPVNLASGEQRGDYLGINPQGLVPALQHDDRLLTQSLGIIDYLEQVFDGPRLWPTDPQQRASVNAVALVIACDVHPLNNLRVQQYLGNEMGLSQEQRMEWYRHWIATGFSAVETMLVSAGRSEFCFGNQPSLADVVLVPQLYNARRFDCDLSDYPNMVRIDARCNEVKAFADARPERQPDAS